MHIALGSLRELDTELIIAKEVSLVDKSLFIPLMNEVEEMRSYYGFNLKYSGYQSSEVQ